jgi:hypothetical protein
MSEIMVASAGGLSLPLQSTFPMRSGAASAHVED